MMIIWSGRVLSYSKYDMTIKISDEIFEEKIIILLIQSTFCLTVFFIFCNLQPAAPLASQLALFSRELVDLLKFSAGCRIPFHKFIPNYHHYFGRQCRVADYGYTKLKDLFEALPHVVQIIGEGSRAMITLSHRAQVKRFTSDLLKVLKTQPAKRLALYDLPAMFSKSLLKTFKISDYGVSSMRQKYFKILLVCIHTFI